MSLAFLRKEMEMRHAMETAKFHAADANHDQLLDKAEMASLFFPETNSAVLDVVAQHTMKAKDKDGDGSLSFKEFVETPDDDEIDVEDWPGLRARRACGLVG